MRKKYIFSNPEKGPKKRKETTDEGEVNTSGKKSKDYHKYRYCPLDGCMSLVKRIPAHLKNVHHLNADSSEYREALSRVRGPVKESYMKPYHERPRVRSPNLSSRNLQEVVLIEEESEEQEDQNYDNASSNQSLDAATTPKAVFQFETWLKSADGGNLDEGTSKQHRVQLSKILKVVDKTEDLASLFNEQVINEKFLEGYAKREYPKTTKAYLMSLHHFYSFCLSEDLGLSISVFFHLCARVALNDTGKKWKKTSIL